MYKYIREKPPLPREQKKKKRKRRGAEKSRSTRRKKKERPFRRGERRRLKEMKIGMRGGGENGEIEEKRRLDNEEKNT